MAFGYVASTSNNLTRGKLKLYTILVPSSAKRIATRILVIAKLNRRKDFILKNFVCDLFLNFVCPVQSYQLKHKNKVWKQFKIKNEDTRTMSMALFIINSEHISDSLLIIDFEQEKVCWVHIEKINTFEDKIRYIVRYVVVI